MGQGWRQPAPSQGAGWWNRLIIYLCSKRGYGENQCSDRSSYHEWLDEPLFGVGDVTGSSCAH